MLKTANRFYISISTVFVVGMPFSILAQGSSEKNKICEVKPIMKCLDKEKIEGRTLTVSLDDAAIARDGFLICDSSFNYTTAPDIVLIMDNTGSMDSVQEINGIPRWCSFPDREVGDPGCISGDPHRQRGPALQTFLDSALAKGGKGVNVGVVTFNEIADAKSDKLLPLTSATIPGIKSSIVMMENSETNYTAAFAAARKLLGTSTKPKAEQFIIFVSDGRPNFPKRPDGDPYSYKQFWDSLPTVHSIFLGDNQANYKDMQDISAHTGGAFFNIADAGLLAKYLTDDLAKKLFRRARPTSTTVKNLTDTITFQMDASKHILTSDSATYTLQMPGPLYLKKGINEIVVNTEYGYGGITQDVHFKINRSASGPYPDFTEACRDLPKLVLFNSQGQALNYLGLPYSINDSLLRYSLTTSVEGLDSFNILVRTTSTVTSQQDLEVVLNTTVNKKDSTWSNFETFQHNKAQKKPGDNQIQIDHGEAIIVSYKNPYIPEDTAQAKVFMKYGKDFDNAAYWDLDGDGRIETVIIQYKEALGTLPNQYKFHITDALGVSADRTALLSKHEIEFAKKSDNSMNDSRLIVTLANPFPFGMTSVVFPDTSGRAFKQLEIPMVDGTFRVDDSVPPVIISANVVRPNKENPFLHLDVQYSEPISLNELALLPIVVKRDTTVFSQTQMSFEGFKKINSHEYVFNLKSGTEYKPVGGDLIAINDNGETRDLLNRTPVKRIFIAMGGAAPSQAVSDFYATFANGSKSKPVGSVESVDQSTVLIPVDAKGYPIPGNENGKCESCTPKQGDAFVGSVIVVVTKYPVIYEFVIFSNFGVVVSRASGKIEEKDLVLLDKKVDPSHDPNLNEYSQRIVWTGRTLTGQIAGTGAYVLKATFRYEQSFKTGGRPSLQTKYLKLGFLRNCCGAPNAPWYE